MPQFNLSAKIKEVNHYNFVITASTQKEAKTKLEKYLETNIPAPFHGDIDTGVTCVNRESGIETEKILTIN